MLFLRFAFRFRLRVRDPGVLPDVTHSRQAFPAVLEFDHEPDLIALRDHPGEPAHRAISIVLRLSADAVRVAVPLFAIGKAVQHRPRASYAALAPEVLAHRRFLSERVRPRRDIREIHRPDDRARSVVPAAGAADRYRRPADLSGFVGGGYVVEAHGKARLLAPAVMQGILRGVGLLRDREIKDHAAVFPARVHAQDAVLAAPEGGGKELLPGLLPVPGTGRRAAGILSLPAEPDRDRAGLAG